jgi:hypothetical protein
LFEAFSFEVQALPKRRIKMPGLESSIIYGTGALLLLATASRFLLQELVAVVVLYKKLKATLKTEYSLDSEKDDMQRLKPPSG